MASDSAGKNTEKGKSQEVSWVESPCSRCGKPGRIPADMPVPSFICQKCGQINTLEQVDLSKSNFDIKKDLAATVVDSHAANMPDEPPQKPDTRVETRPDPRMSEDSFIIEDCPACSGKVILEKENRFKLLAHCPSCRRVFIRPRTRQGDTRRVEQEVKPPNRKQLDLLNLLDFVGEADSMEQATEILLYVLKIIEESIQKMMPGFRLLHHELRMNVIVDVVKSPVFMKIYFSGEEVSEKELKDVVGSTLKDRELASAITLSMPETHFRNTEKFITAYGTYAHGIELEGEEVNKLAMKTWYRGYGAKLIPFGVVGYDENDVVLCRSEKPKPGELYSYYNRKDGNSLSLDILFAEHDILAKKNKAGCAAASVVIAMFIPGAVAVLQLFF